MSFENLKLTKPILNALTNEGYTAPTPIQQKAIPVILEGKDILGSAQTGTGKTGLATAFLIHAIDKGFNGRFIAFPDLVEKLYRSVADHTEDKVVKKCPAG